MVNFEIAIERSIKSNNSLSTLIGFIPECIGNTHLGQFQAHNLSLNGTIPYNITDLNLQN